MKKYICFLLFIALCSALIPSFVNAEPAFGESYFQEIFFDNLRDRDAKELDPQVVSGKIVGIYFSSSGCRGCLIFSRLLIPFYEKHNDLFEVVLAGYDETEEKMYAYMHDYDMKWPAIPFDSQSKADAKLRYEVTSIPALIILGPNGQVLTKDGVKDVERLEDQAITYWLNLAREAAKANADSN